MIPARGFRKAILSAKFRTAKSFINIGDTMQPRIRSFIAAFIGVLSFGAASTAWADNIYLKVAGVTGPVTTTGYAGDIEILSYSQGFSNNGTTASCSDTTLQKTIDVTSQFFARNVLEQSAPFNATLYFVNSATQAVYTTILLKGTSVTSVQHAGSEGGGSLTESLSLHASSILVTFTNSDGSKQSYTTTCS